jgi:CheY-like chemotaxis protein
MLMTPPRLKVLVVEDVPEVRGLVARAIASFGHQGQEAGGGDEALSLCERALPDVVLTDILMPGTDGLTLTQRIRERWPACPVVVMTGRSDEASAIAALKAGACDYLKKPINPEALRAALEGVAQVLDAQRAQSLGGLPVERLDFQIVLGNTLDRLVPLTSLLLRDVAPLLAGPARFHLRIALQELLVNAIEHGNLEISADDKMDALARGDYDRLVEARRQDARFQDRCVAVGIVYDRAKGSVRFRITDEGAGFDWRTWRALRRWGPPLTAPAAAFYSPGLWSLISPTMRGGTKRS